MLANQYQALGSFDLASPTSRRVEQELLKAKAVVSNEQLDGEQRSRRRRPAPAAEYDYSDAIEEMAALSADAGQPFARSRSRLLPGLDIDIGESGPAIPRTKSHPSLLTRRRNGSSAGATDSTATETSAASSASSSSSSSTPSRFTDAIAVVESQRPDAERPRSAEDDSWLHALREVQVRVPTRWCMHVHARARRRRCVNVRAFLETSVSFIFPFLLVLLSSFFFFAACDALDALAG